MVDSSRELLETRGHPVLSSDFLRGYLHLQQEEAHFTSIALTRQKDMVEIWYRLLSLYDDAASMTHNPTFSLEGLLDQQLRLQFLAVAGGTAKAVLDLGLAGHYAQGYALARHLLETIVRMKYVETRPDEAARWYVSADGMPPQPPNVNTMNRTLRDRLKDNELASINMVIKNAERMDKMAHPSEHTPLQTVVDGQNAVKIGGNYLEGLCFDLLHNGASGVRLLLEMWNHMNTFPKEWNVELNSVIREHANVTDRYRMSHPESEL